MTWMATPRKLEPDDTEYDPRMDEIGKYVLHYDRAGQAITLRQWAILAETDDYRRIAEDWLDDGHIRVSTVWLGIDHGFLRHGPPMIFETMVFVRMTPEQIKERHRDFIGAGLDHGADYLERFPYEGQETERYATEAQAREGHRAIVQSLTVPEL